MTTSLARRALPWILRAPLSVLMLLAGLTKFLPEAGWDARFAAWGYATWFVAVIGTLEVVGAVGLWIPRVRQPAAIGLAVLMLGAIYTNLTHPPMAEAIRPLSFLLAFGGLAWLQRSDAPDTVVA
ncbi:MAG: DoxX family protein [Gemmatimonadetes bacterium]|nr:DoxX family protein [Gemmatimonadota bacterium]